MTKKEMTTKKEMMTGRQINKIEAIRTQASMLYEIKKEPTKAFVAYVIAYLLENEIKWFDEFINKSEEAIIISLYNEPEFIVNILQIDKKHLDEIFTHYKNLFLKIE